MRTKQAVVAMSMAAALMGLASQVHAGPVTQLALGADGAFSNPNIGSKSGQNFANVFSGLLLSADTLVSGNLFTKANMAVDVEDVYLLKLDGNGKADPASRLSFTQTVGRDWSKPGYGAEEWTLAPVSLSAGQWELHVNGYLEGAKHGAAFNGQLKTGSNNVPEPQSLALSLVALAAMAGLSRRRQKA